MIQLENICKQYTNHNHTVRAVDDVSFSVAENERVLLVVVVLVKVHCLG